MGALFASAVATAAFVKGTLLGLVVGATAVACACRKARRTDAREHPRKPRPEPQKG